MALSDERRRREADTIVHDLAHSAFMNLGLPLHSPARAHPSHSACLFASCAALAMERLSTLTRRQAREEQEAVPEHMRRKQGFDLRGSKCSKGFWVVGLFRMWLRHDGARLMGATELWREISGDPVPSAALPPLYFSLGGVVANVETTEHMDTN